LGARQWRGLGAEVVDGTVGDSLKSLKALERWDYDVYDIDPWGDPFAAMSMVASHATAGAIGLFLCDGALRQMAQIGGYLPRAVCAVTGWPSGAGPDTRWRKRWIYHHYHTAVRHVCTVVIAPRYQLTDIGIVDRIGHSTANYIGVIARRQAAS